MFELDKDTFETEVLQGTGYVLVDFWSEGCEPCKALMPDIQEMEKLMVSKLDLLNLTQLKQED